MWEQRSRGLDQGAGRFLSWQAWPAKRNAAAQPPQISPV